MRRKYSPVKRMWTRAGRLQDQLTNWLNETTARCSLWRLEKECALDDTEELLAVYDLIHALEKRGKSCEALMLRRKALAMLSDNKVDLIELLPAA